MTFTHEQQKEAYKKLPPEAQDFIMSNEIEELIENYLNEVSLTGEQSVDANSEILYAMYGLQTLSEAIINIAKLSGKDENSFSKLKENLQNFIFDKIPQGTEGEPEEYQSSVGQSFEDIILNQARAMQPAFASPELGYGVAKPATDEQRREEIPNNLPTDDQKEEGKPQEEPKAIHNYIGTDPYREPVE